MLEKYDREPDSDTRFHLVRGYKTVTILLYNCIVYPKQIYFRKLSSPTETKNKPS